MTKVFQSLRASVTRNARTFAAGLLLVCAVSAVYQSPLLLEQLIEIKPKRAEGSAEALKLKYDQLSDGLYYFSLGRPHGSCTIFVGATKFAENSTPSSNLRSDLTIGFPLRISQPQQLEITVSCLSNDSSKPSLNHAPILANFYAGFFLQCARTFTYILLGPLASALILFASLLVLIGKDSAALGAQARGIDLRVICFGISGLLYSMSLAHFPRLFAPELYAALGHVLVRHVFSLAFLYLVYRYTTTSRFWILAHFASAVIATASFSIDPNQLYSTYKWLSFLFPVSSLFAFQSFRTAEVRSRAHDLMRFVTATWVLNQSFDVANLWVRFGPYNAPALLAVVCALLFVVKVEERKQQDLLASSQQRLINLTRMSTEPREILRAIASELRTAGGFVRASAYIDRYVLGATSAPRVELERAFEEGYSKDTSRDFVVSLVDGRGIKMLEAIERREAILHKGSDGEWFITIGLEHACVNLSIFSAKLDFLAHQALDLVRAIRPSLREFETKLTDVTTKTRLAMHKVRAARGIGTWTLDTGAIFLDVVGYSSQSTLLGGQYVRFIRNIFLDALFKKVSPYAQVEMTIGDEVYLSVLPDFLTAGNSVEQATISALRVIDEFVRTEGANLSMSEGFQPPQLRVGADFGRVELIVSETEVVTLGQPVNFAKRLQTASKRGEILVSSHLAELLRMNAFVGSERRILEKGDVILARSIAFNKAA